jgi:hypothetical protein
MPAQTAWAIFVAQDEKDGSALGGESGSQDFLAKKILVTESCIAHKNTKHQLPLVFCATDHTRLKIFNS